MGIPFKEVMGAAFAEANRGEKIVSNVGNTVQKIGLKIFRRAAKLWCGFPKKLDGFSTFSDIDTDDACAGLIARVDNMLTFSKDYFAKCELERSSEKRTEKRDKIATALSKRLGDLRDRFGNICNRRINA